MIASTGRVWCASLPHYLWRGQLPGLIDFDDQDIPSYWSSYVQTYVERDIRLLANLADLGQFGRFLRICGALTGQELIQAHMGRELGVVLNFNGHLYPVEFKAASHLTGYDARGIQWMKDKGPGNGCFRAPGSALK